MTEPKSPLVPKKLAYIKFKNQSSAAKAYENCDPGMMASRSKLLKIMSSLLSHLVSDFKPLFANIKFVDPAFPSNDQKGDHFDQPPRNFHGLLSFACVDTSYESIVLFTAKSYFQTTNRHRVILETKAFIANRNHEVDRLSIQDTDRVVQILVTSKLSLCA